MNLRDNKLHSLIVMALLAAGCGGSPASGQQSTGPEPASEPEPAPAPASIAATKGDIDALSVCINVYERQAQCTDEFIPVLVDLRIKHDLPAGIAAEGQTEEGRDKVIAAAKAEWAEDSKPENVKPTCERGVTNMPPEAVEAMANRGTECLAIEDCAAFVTCVAPGYDEMFTRQKAMQQ